MLKSEPLIRTKLRLPFIQPGLVSRPRLQERIARGLRGPLTLVTAPAGFGKTTLVASCVSGCGMPVAWLSLDKDDNQPGRFLTYLLAALWGTDDQIGREAAELVAKVQPASAETVLTSLVNDLDRSGRDLALVLDDYQFMSNQAAHEGVAFLLEHCPRTLHIVIATRSDPPLPLARLRASARTVELRAADLRFTEFEAAQFLNDVMGLHLDVKSVAVLDERTEGWIAGLQMAALSMRDRRDVLRFIEAFSGTNRYIMDYLLQEVLASQSVQVKRFLLSTSILERLSAPLCDFVLRADEGFEAEKDEPTNSKSIPVGPSAAILEYLEQANLFLLPLDDERIWYRYHHLFADLLRADLLKSVGTQRIAELHLRAAAWHEQNGFILDAVHHASLACADEMVERLIEQNYFELMNRGEMSSVRYWLGDLSKELVYRRPWLCLYEAMSRSWYGELPEADLLLDVAEKRIRQFHAPEAEAMLAYHSYVKSRVTAMQGDTPQAIEFCLAAREHCPPENPGLQIDFCITLGYEYFLHGDFVNADKTLNEVIQLGHITGAVNNPVAAFCLLARMQSYQGLLQQAHETLAKAEQLVHKTGDRTLGVSGLVDVEMAGLLCEWNDLEAALARLKEGIDNLLMWGKADDWCLAYATLSRIQLAQGKLSEAADTIAKAAQIVQTRGIFSEARRTVEAAQVKIWLAQADWPAVNAWATRFERTRSNDPFRFQDELTHITLAQVYISQKKFDEAIPLIASLEESSRSAGRQGRLIQVLVLQALALQGKGDSARAGIALSNSLALAEPEGYVRLFLDEGRPMRLLLAEWLAHAQPGPLQTYAVHLLSKFDAEPHAAQAEKDQAAPAQKLVEPLSPREVQVLRLLALGKTNLEISQELVVSPGTVKAHTSSIYRKLDTANRTEAVARARQLGILP